MSVAAAEKRPAPSGGSGRSGMLRLFQDFGGTFLTILVKMGFGIAIGIITARTLGPVNRGIFALVSTFPATLVTLTKFGQSQATIYFIRREGVDVARVAANTLWFGVVTGAALIGLVVLLREPILGSVLRGVPLWALLAVTPMIPILLVESYLYGVLQATDRFKVYNTRLLAESVLALVGMATVLLLFGWGLPGAIGVSVTLHAVMLAWVFVTILRTTPIGFGFDRSLFRRMLRYGTKSHLQIVASHFNFKVGVYLCAFFLSPAEVAFYSIGARLAEQMMSLPQSLGLAMFPRLAGMSPDRVHAMTAAACRQTLIVAVAMAVFLSLAGRFAIVTLYGPDYEAAAVPLRYISWGIVMMSMYVLLSRDFTARDRQLINVIAAYVALVGNVGLNVWLIPLWGIEGAAIGTAASYTTAALLLYVFFLRESGLPWHAPLILKREDLARWKALALEARARGGRRRRKAAARSDAAE